MINSLEFHQHHVSFFIYSKTSILLRILLGSRHEFNLDEYFHFRTIKSLLCEISHSYFTVHDFC
jgi:hypothetical protein